MSLSLLLVFLFLGICVPPYLADNSAGQCTLYYDESRDVGASIPCSVAFFSSFNFAVKGNVLYDQQFTGCIEDASYVSTFEKTILAVQRGSCAFDVKASMASKLGYKALVVINNVNSEPFPMGSDEATFVSSIPAVMIPQHAFSSMDNDGSDTPLMMKVKYSGATHTIESVRINQWRDYNVYLVHQLSLIVFLCVLLYLCQCAILEYTRHNLKLKKEEEKDALKREHMQKNIHNRNNSDDSQYGTISIDSSSCSDDEVLQEITHRSTLLNKLLVYIQERLPYIITAFMVILLRLGTYRLLDTNNHTSTTYHHRETDEVIFSSLIHDVGLDFHDYTLKDKPLLSQIGLTAENYQDSVFIHPPIFVYLSVFLHDYLGMALPSISILFHLITAGFLADIMHFGKFFRDISLKDKKRSHRMEELASLWAVVIYSLDPLAFFCGQKIWIDNCLVCSVTIVVAVHMALWDLDFHHQSKSGKRTWYSWDLGGTAIVSGAIFGLLVLNTKITGLALLPVLVLWSCHRICVSSTENVKEKAMLCIMCSVLFVLGTVIGHAPWMLYYYSNTGRFLPNAWPTTTMLQYSSYMQQAIQKPVYFYLQQLLLFCPLQLIGFVYGVYHSPRTIFRTWYYYSDTKIIHSEQLVPLTVDENATTILSVWPLAFLGGFTYIGWLGAGYQTRFILPIIPATSILISVALVRNITRRDFIASPSSGMICMLSLLLCYSMCYVMYYGILFTPFYADLEVSLIDVLVTILEQPYAPMHDSHAMRKALMMMKHYGLVLKIKE